METDTVSNRQGKIVGIPPETQEQIRQDKISGMSVAEIAEKFNISENTVRKYCKPIIKPVAVSSENEINTDVEKVVLSQHAGNVLDYAKKYDSEVISGGDALKKYLESKGISVDFEKIPKDQLIKLVQSPGLRGVDDMNTDTKSLLDELLKEKIANLKNEGAGELSIEKLLNYKLLMRMFAEDGNGGSVQWQQMLQEMRSENEKQRQFYEKQLGEMQSKFRDLVIERRFQDAEDRQLSLSQSLQDQLTEISGKIETYRDVAISGTPGEKLDAISHIEKLAEERARVNKAMEKLNQTQVLIQSPAAPGSPDSYIKPDGSTDFLRYAGDKIESSVKMITDAYSKRAPDRKEVAETPVSEHRMSIDEAEQLYQQLLRKPTVTLTEKNWINGYLPIRAQYYPPVPDNSSAATSNNTAPEVSDEPVSSAEHTKPAEPVPVAEAPEPIKPVLERMQENEIAAAKELADLGF